MAVSRITRRSFRSAPTRKSRRWTAKCCARALQRAAILSNEKYRGVKLELSPGKLRIVAHNPEQEEADEEVEAETHVSDLAVGFNVGYLLDALGRTARRKARLSLRDAQSSCLVQEHDNEHARHVIMPLRL